MLTVIRPPYFSKIASEIAAKMFLLVKVITITGRLSLVAKIALTIPRTAPKTIETSNETTLLFVAL